MKNQITISLLKASRPSQRGKNSSLKINITNIYNNEIAMRELKKIYQHEKELLVAIPLFMMEATTFELVDYLNIHVKYTKEHIKLLEDLFPTIGE